MEWLTKDHRTQKKVTSMYTILYITKGRKSPYSLNLPSTTTFLYLPSPARQHCIPSVPPPSHPTLPQPGSLTPSRIHTYTHSSLPPHIHIQASYSHTHTVLRNTTHTTAQAHCSNFALFHIHPTHFTHTSHAPVSLHACTPPLPPSIPPHTHTHTQNSPSTARMAGGEVLLPTMFDAVHT